MPTALLNVLAPFYFALPPCSFHVRQDRRVKLYELSRWQLQHRPAVAARAPVHLFDFLPFFLQSPLILGHGLV